MNKYFLLNLLLITNLVNISFGSEKNNSSNNQIAHCMLIFSLLDSKIESKLKEEQNKMTAEESKAWQDVEIVLQKIKEFDNTVRPYNQPDFD